MYIYKLESMGQVNSRPLFAGELGKEKNTEFKSPKFNSARYSAEESRSIYVCICVFSSMYMYVYIRVFIYVCIHVYGCVCMCMYVFFFLPFCLFLSIFFFFTNLYFSTVYRLNG